MTEKGDFCPKNVAIATELETFETAQLAKEIELELQLPDPEDEAVSEEVEGNDE